MMASLSSGMSLFEESQLSTARLVTPSFSPSHARSAAMEASQTLICSLVGMGPMIRRKCIIFKFFHFWR